MSLGNFYRRKKNPWIGSILVVLFGPLGFLYHSWKSAMAVFVIVLLWVIFLRGTSLDLTENAWPRYTVLLLLAIVAWLQIRGEHS